MSSEHNIDQLKAGDEGTQSKDLVQANINQLKALFPEIVTEGKINFKALQEVLGEEVEEGDEYYRFTWAGKTQARREAHKPSTGTLRPCEEESVDWEKTQNLYLEGDNLEVLKLLQKSYANKVKMIYIDPPYNTGKDFVYKDNYKDNLKNYQQLTGQLDDDGNKISTNSDTDGRFHSNWLNMMYPRLRLARNLLKDDGVIFMSIDDNEVENLKKLGNEVFGEENFVANIIWQKKFSRSNDATFFSTMHDHILCFAKQINNGWTINLLPRNIDELKGYSNPDNDSRGIWTSVILSAKSGSEKLKYKITTPSGRECYPPNGRYWSVNQDRFQELVADNRIWFGMNGKGTPRLKTFFSEVQSGLRPNTIWLHSEVGHNQEGKQEFKKLFDDKGYFDSPKPTRLLHQLLNITSSEKDYLVLDFFSGSASTAHSVIKANFQDYGYRNFIQVQLPEATDKKSEAHKAGYKTIAEIGKERIRRAAKKIKTEAQAAINSQKEALAKLTEGSLNLEDERIKTLEKAILAAETNLAQQDFGFKVFKLDSSNIKAWDGHPDNLEGALFAAEENFKADRSEADILYEVLLKYGLDLTLPIATKTIADKTVYAVGDGALFLCLAKGITKEVAAGIGAWKAELAPAMCRVVFRDSGFGSDADKTNATTELKTFGITEIKSI